MNKIEFQLIQIEGFTYTKCNSVYNSLNKPLEESLLHDMLKEHGLFDKRLIELYLWKNGNQKAGSSTPYFCSWGHFFSLNHATDIFNSKEYKSVFKEKSFFPIIGHGGDFLLLNLQRNKKAVYAFSPSLLINTPISFCDSLGLLLEGIGYCFEHGIYRTDSENNFDSDSEREDSFFRSKSPTAQYWNISFC